MNDSEDDFLALMERFAQGDEQAFTKLYDKYHKAVINIVRYHLDPSPRLRTQFDSTDFSQSVWEELWANRGDLHGMTSYREFLRRLWNMIRHNVEKTRRKHLDSQKRDLRRTRSLSDPVVSDAASVMADHRPAPGEELSVADFWEFWIRSLPPRYQILARLLRRGFSHRSIAYALGCSVRTVERTVAKLRRKFPLEFSQ